MCRLIRRVKGLSEEGRSSGHGEAMYELLRAKWPKGTQEAGGGVSANGLHHT